MCIINTKISNNMCCIQSFLNWNVLHLNRQINFLVCIHLIFVGSDIRRKYHWNLAFYMQMNGLWIFMDLFPRQTLPLIAQLITLSSNEWSLKSSVFIYYYGHIWCYCMESPALTFGAIRYLLKLGIIEIYFWMIFFNWKGQILD